MPNKIDERFTDNVKTVSLLTIDFSSDADYTITSSQMKNGVFYMTDTGVVLTGGVNVNVPLGEYGFVLKNSTAQTLTVKTTTGTGVSILSGEIKDLICDGTDVIDQNASKVDDTDFTVSKQITYNQSVTGNFASDADYTLSSTENEYGRIVLTDTGVLLTAGRNVIVSNLERSFLFQNDTAQTLTVKTAAGIGIAVTAATRVHLLCDGTNVETLTY